MRIGVSFDGFGTFAEALAFARADDARPFAAHIQRHQQVEIGVRVRGEGERRQTGFRHRNPKLFRQFPDQRLLWRFVRLHFPTRKFP